MRLALAVAAVTGKDAGPGRAGAAPRRLGVPGEASSEEYAALRLEARVLVITVARRRRVTGISHMPK